MSDDQEPPTPQGEPRALTEHWADLRQQPLLQRLDDAALATFVMEVCDGKIFTLHHIREHDRESMVPMVFMPVALGAFSGWYGVDLEQVGTIWEYLSEAGPRAINGYPMFFSLRVMHKDDWARATRAIDRELERRKTPQSVLDDLKEPAP